VFQNAQIRPDHALDTRAADFDHDRRTILERGAIHLRDRCCSKRDRIEKGKHFGRFALDGGHQIRLQKFQGYRWHLAVQLLKLCNPVWRKQIHPCGQQLPQLDESRAQLFERAAYSHRRVELADFVAALPMQDPPGTFQHAADAQHPYQIAPAITNHHRGDFMQARQVAHNRNGFPEH